MLKPAFAQACAVWKTDAAYRDGVLCSALTHLLKEHIGKRSGLLFPSGTGKAPMTCSNIRGRSLRPKLEELTLYPVGRDALLPPISLLSSKEEPVR